LIDQLLVICSAIIIYEFIKYVQLIYIVKSNLKIYHKILNLFQYKNVSDFRKEKLIFNYSKSLLLVSIKIIVILISIVAFMIILNFLSNSYLNLVLSLFGIIELSVFFLIYHLIRKRFYAKL
jgi:hypothetical protein